ncbi:MAG TPA: hypothetical protein VN725_01280 [Rhodanobacteraceae bacterium]|nr:hypothetical protein [Rhodanobacteraceae bacterium]
MLCVLGAGGCEQAASKAVAKQKTANRKSAAFDKTRTPEILDTDQRGWLLISHSGASRYPAIFVGTARSNESRVAP